MKVLRRRMAPASRKGRNARVYWASGAPQLSRRKGNDIMPSWVQLVSARLSQLLRRNSVIDAEIGDLNLFGPLLIDRGYGLLYDVERNITWLQDANYAKSVGRSPDGQLTW